MASAGQDDGCGIPKLPPRRVAFAGRRAARAGAMLACILLPLGCTGGTLRQSRDLPAVMAAPIDGILREKLSRPALDVLVHEMPQDTNSWQASPRGMTTGENIAFAVVYTITLGGILLLPFSPLIGLNIALNDPKIPEDLLTSFAEIDLRPSFQSAFLAQSSEFVSHPVLGCIKEADGVGCDAGPAGEVDSRVRVEIQLLIAGPTALMREQAVCVNLRVSVDAIWDPLSPDRTRPGSYHRAWRWRAPAQDYLEIAKRDLTALQAVIDHGMRDLAQRLVDDLWRRTTPEPVAAEDPRQPLRDRVLAQKPGSIVPLTF